MKAGWHASLAEGLETARRENKPVLIDMWATWCKNCLTMDKTTLANADVQTALTGYVKIKYQAEDPDAAASEGRDAEAFSTRASGLRDPSTKILSLHHEEH